MNQPYYQEKFKIGHEAIGPGFDPARRVAGEGDSNLKYIYSETGADVTVRGRGSGYIEPRMGRESSDTLHVLVQHDSSYEAFIKACQLVQDLIQTVKEDWCKLQWKQTKPQGKGDLYWQEEKPGSSRSVSSSKDKDKGERRDLRGKQVPVHRGEGRDRCQNFKGLYDDMQEMEDIRGDRELLLKQNVWGSSRDSDKNTYVEDDWQCGRGYQDKHQRSLDQGDHLKRSEWQTPKELGLGNRCGNGNLEKGERSSYKCRDKSWTPENKWSERNQLEERRWNDTGPYEENPRSNEKKDGWFWDCGQQKEKHGRKNKKEGTSTKWPWDSGLQEEKLSRRDEKEDHRTEQRRWDEDLQKEKMWNERDSGKTKRSWDNRLQEEKQGIRSEKEGDRSERRRWDGGLQKEKRWNERDCGKTKRSWDNKLQEDKQGIRSEKEDDRSKRRRYDGGLQKEKLSRWNKNDSGRSEKSWGSSSQEEKLRKHNEDLRFGQRWDKEKNVKEQKDKNQDHLDLGNRKKSRWDIANVKVKGSSATPDKNVLGLILDQKKKIEEKLSKGCMPPGDFDPQTSATLMNSIPLEMNQNQLQDLNHRQLLQISQQQQALLLQLSANLTQQGPLQVVNSMSFNSLTNQVNPMLNFPSNPIYNFQPLNSVPSVISEATELRSEMCDRKQFFSEDRSNNISRYPWTDSSNSVRQSPPRQWQEEDKPMYADKERSRHSSIRRSRSPMFRTPPSHRTSPFLRNSSPRQSSPTRNSEFSSPPRKNSQLQIYSPYDDITPLMLSTYRGNERYSPQLNDGQERYSPQLEVDFRMRSPELYSRREDQHMYQSKNQMQEEKKRKQLLRFRVAVIDKKFDKLTPQDEEEIKNLVYKELNTLPISCGYQIDFLGFGSQDYVFVLMPHSLEAMKWLVNVKHLESMCRGYTLFPYEDIYNRFRMRSILFFDLLEGYRPNPEEVILELGRMNSGLCTEMWKTVLFTENEKGFCIEISVDFLSYLQLKKLQWKPCYRVSFIRLEPVKSEKSIDERFNKRLRV